MSKVSKEREDLVKYLAQVLQNNGNLEKLYNLFFPAEGIEEADTTLLFRGGYLESIPTLNEDGSARQKEDIAFDYEVRVAALKMVRSVLGAISKEINPKPASKKKDVSYT